MNDDTEAGGTISTTRDPGDAATTVVDDPISTLLRDHFAVGLALMSSLLVAARLFGASGLHMDTALAILAAGGAAGLLIGMGTTLLPLGSAVLLVAAFAIYRRRKLRALEVILFTLTVPLAAALALTSPITTLTAAAFLAWNLRSPGPVSVTAKVAAIVLGAIISFGWAFTSELWLPAERISTSGERFPGYVVGETAGWVTLLRDSDRRVIFRKPNEIAARESCVIIIPTYLTMSFLDLARHLWPGLDPGQLPYCYAD